MGAVTGYKEKYMITFKNQNMKLAIINQLLDEELLTLDMPQLKTREERHAWLDMVPVTKVLAEKLTTLCLEAGSDIYQYVEPEWDGEDDLFLIEDLSDLQWFPNLERLEDTGLLHVKDASALLGLPKLAFVEVNYGWGIDDQPVLDQLKARGVTIGDEYPTLASKEEDGELSEYEQQFNMAYDLLWEEGDVKGALALFHTLSKAFPEDSDIWLEIGNAYEQLDQLDKAEHAFAYCLKINPENEFALYGMANILLDKEDYVFALTSIESAIKYGLDDMPEAWHLRAQICVYLRHSEQAKEFFNHALTLYTGMLEYEEERPEALFQMACIHNSLGNPAAALDYLEKAIECEPEMAERAQSDREFLSLMADKRFLELTGR